MPDIAIMCNAAFLFSILVIEASEARVMDSAVKVTRMTADFFSILCSIRAKPVRLVPYSP